MAATHVYNWSVHGFAVGSTGNAFISTYLKEWTPQPHLPLGQEEITVAEIDAFGTLVFNIGQEQKAWTNYSSNVIGGLVVAGPDAYALTANFSGWGPPANTYYRTSSVDTSTLKVGGDAVWPPWLLDPDPQIWGFRDVAGNTLIYGQGSGPSNSWFSPSNTFVGGNVLWKLDPNNAFVWGVNLAPCSSVTPMSVHVAPETGKSYITGELASGVDLGCGPIPGTGSFAGAIDAFGQCVWSRAVGSSPSIVNAGASDYLLGSFTGSLDVGCGAMTSAGTAQYVAKLDAATGACQWSRAFPATNTIALTRLADGDPLILGTASSSSPDAGCGPIQGGSGVYLAKLDAAGACVWSKGFDASIDVAPFPSGDVGVSAVAGGTLDFGCGPLPAAGTQDLALGRLDGSTGACLWSKRFGAAGAAVEKRQFEISNALGFPIFLGNVTGDPVDFGGGAIANTSFVVELDGAGALRFQSAIPTSSNPRFALDPCGFPLVLTAGDACGPNGGVGETVTKLAP